MNFRNRVARIATTLSAARSCALAVEAGRRPDDTALEAVGVDPEAFKTIRFR